MDLLLELMSISERMYAKDGDLFISIQHSKESSDKEAISTFMRRNPYQTHLPGARGVDIYSLLNYVSSPETTKLLQSLKGKGPYSIKRNHYDGFIDELANQAGSVISKLRPDTIIMPKSSSNFIRDFGKKLKSSYPKAVYLEDALVKRVLDAENVEPLLNKEHPDWPKFESENPKEVNELRKSLVRMIKTKGQLEAKSIFKQYAKFIKNFIELRGSTDILDHLVDKKVLILDDIISSGVTMVDMIREMQEMEAKEVFGFTIFKRTSAVKEENYENI